MTQTQSTQRGVVVSVASGRAFRGSSQWGYRALVVPDGTVYVWDDLGGSYTLLHSLTVRQIARVRAQAARATA